MKQIKFAVFALALTLTAVSYTPANAEDKKGKKEYIEKFEAGRKLTAADIKFLNGITTNGSTDDKSAMVGKTGFKQGQTITQAEADIINKAKDDFRKSHKMAKATDAKKIDRTRGNETCYWYLYCDGYGNCYYIWYCD